MTKILSAPLILQKTNKDCGLAVIATVLAYDKREVDYFDLVRQYKADQKDFNGIFLYEIGTYFLQHDYKVTLQTGNTHLFNRHQANLSQPELREHVTWLKEDRYPNKFQNGLQTLADFMDHGGIVEVKIPEADDLRKEVDRGRPIPVSLTNAFMGFGGEGYKTKKPFSAGGVGHNMHFATIIGYEQDGFFINDPGKAYSQGKTQRYTAADTMFGIHANSAGDVDNCAFLKLTLC